MLQKRYVRFLSVLLSLAFLAFTGCTNSQEQIPVSTPGTPVVQAEASEPEQSQTSNREDGAPFSLTMLDVGQGLSILVQADGEYLLYDGGGRGASSYVVAYHGSSSSTSEELLDAASPAYAFLSVGEDNPYGHPTAQTLNALQQHEITLYRTDQQGEVTVYSDGQKCWFSTEPCQDWSAGNQAIAEKPLSTTVPQTAQYVLNTHTKKFHFPDWPSVDQMSEKNKEFTDASRDELIARGYPHLGHVRHPHQRAGHGPCLR